MNNLRTTPHTSSGCHSHDIMREVGYPAVNNGAKSVWLMPLTNHITQDATDYLQPNKIDSLFSVIMKQVQTTVERSVEMHFLWRSDGSLPVGLLGDLHPSLDKLKYTDEHLSALVPRGPATVTACRTLTLEPWCCATRWGFYTPDAQMKKQHANTKCQDLKGSLFTPAPTSDWGRNTGKKN